MYQRSFEKTKDPEEEDRKKWYKQAKSQEPFPTLPVIEILFYFISFWTAAGYSLYRFYLTSQRWGQYLHLTVVEDSLFGSRQDQTDLEWFVWPSIILDTLPWAILHLILAQIVRKNCPQYQSLFYVVYTCCLLRQTIGLLGVLLCILVPAIMFIVLLSRLKLFIWLAWCLILIIFNTQVFMNYMETWLEEIPEGDYKVSVMIAWIILRSLSFSLETCDEDPEGMLIPSQQFINLLGYCLYLPFVYTGPYMPFTDFKKGLCLPYQPWTLERVLYVALHLIRFLGWLAFCNITLYFFYAHSLHFSPELLKKLNSWSLAGYVYFLTVFFTVKYVVMYGLLSVLSRAEGYDPPRHPRCTLMTYRFSDIWRYFDHGLYRFMLRHIYIPWISCDPGSMMRQVQGTVLVFTFIYVWHGVTAPIFWWAAINCGGVIIEKVAEKVKSKPEVMQWEQQWLPGAWQRRIHGIAAVCLYVPSLAALTLFLAGLDHAALVAHRIFISGFPSTTSATFFFMFCLGQCSMELQNYKLRRKKKEQEKQE